MKRYLRFPFTVLLLSVQFVVYNVCAQAQKWSPEHVYYGKGGALTYTPDEKGNVIPDFSNVGYMYGDESIPDVPVVREVSPVDGDDGASIQAAIDLVEAMIPDENGFRGAVLLKKGTYEVAGQLTIRASGVVLRGEGQTDAGTVIIAMGTNQRELINIGNGSNRSINQASGVTISEDYVPVGRKFVVVTDASAYNQGDHIALYRPGTQKWISDLKMDQITNPNGNTVQWTPSSYSFYFERLVTKVSGDTIFFRNPVVMAMETQYGGGSVYKASFNRLQQVGVEDLCLKSSYTSATDEDHSWKAVEFNSIENGWARRITSWYFAYSCVSLERNSRLISVLDCHCRDPKSIITGGRRYSFNLVGSLNLFKGCTTTEGRHDYVSSSRVCGPNVFTDCSASNTHSDAGPHHRWAMGTLYDIITTDGAINVQDRDDSGTGHGWAGANHVFWNCKGSSSVCQSPWVSALNYNFGFIGGKSNGKNAGRPDGEWVGHNQPGIFPGSLYEAQLDWRKNETRLFSVLSQLKATSDSSFVISFNMPVDTSTINAENFSIGGTAGFEGKDFSFSLQGDTAVSFVFDGIGLLPTFSLVCITASNINSSQGDTILGLRDAIYIEPDKSPIVFGTRLQVNNENGFGNASTTKPGAIYIILIGNYPGTELELDSLVRANLGRKVETDEINVLVPIYTKGLPGGAYAYYAVDEDGRVSEPDFSWLIVAETGPVTHEHTIASGTPFNTYQSNGLIIVDPGNNTKYELEIYSITGRLLFRENKLSGRQYINLNNYKGIIILRKQSESVIETRKMIKY